MIDTNYEIELPEGERADTFRIDGGVFVVSMAECAAMELDEVKSDNWPSDPVAISLRECYTEEIMNGYSRLFLSVVKHAFREYESGDKSILPFLLVDGYEYTVMATGIDTRERRRLYAKHLVIASGFDPEECLVNP